LVREVLAELGVKVLFLPVYTKLSRIPVALVAG